MFHIFGNNLGFKTTNNLYLTTLLIRVMYMAVINNIHINTQCVSHFDLETSFGHKCWLMLFLD